MRNLRQAVALFVGSAAAAAMVVLVVKACVVPAEAAVVGTLDFQGDVITGPILFKNAFNSVLEVEDGLKFRIAPGQQGPVRLELLQGTSNIALAAIAIGGASAVSASLPLSITTDPLSQGLHKFAVSALAAGNSAVVARLTLTPVPGALLLAATGGAALLGWNFARARPQPSQAA